MTIKQVRVAEQSVTETSEVRFAAIDKLLGIAMSVLAQRELLLQLHNAKPKRAGWSGSKAYEESTFEMEGAIHAAASKLDRALMTAAREVLDADTKLFAAFDMRRKAIQRDIQRDVKADLKRNKAKDQ